MLLPRFVTLYRFRELDFGSKIFQKAIEPVLIAADMSVLFYMKPASAIPPEASARYKGKG
jgi:hypothetical protein